MIGALTKAKILYYHNIMILPSKKIVLIEPIEIKTGQKIEWVSEKKQETGKVVAVGEGKTPVKMKVGDIIAYRRFGEDKLYYEGKAYLFVTFPDILAVIQ